MPKNPDCDDPTCELGFRYDPTQPKGQRRIRCKVCRPTHKPLLPPIPRHRLPTR